MILPLIHTHIYNLVFIFLLLIKNRVKILFLKNRKINSDKNSYFKEIKKRGKIPGKNSHEPPLRTFINEYYLF